MSASRDPFRQSAALGILQSVAMRYGLGAAIVIAWQIAAAHAESVFFPTPLEIVLRSGELWFSGPASRLFLSDGVFDDVLPSLMRLLGGWCLAVLVGVSLGFLIGRSRVVSDIVDPSLQFLRAIPGTALIPIFIILLGTEATMRVALIAFGSVWPILLNTIEGVRTVDYAQIDTARSFRLPRMARVARVILPSAMPKIMAGMRVSLSLAVILMVVSELVASTNGIGYRILNAQALLLLTDMWCGMLLLALLGYGLNAMFLRIERRVLAWHRGARQRSDV